MNFARKINTKGGISIPVAVRREYAIQAQDVFQITTNATGDIVLKRQAPHCIFCGAVTDKVYRAHAVCEGCAQAISENKEAE